MAINYPGPFELRIFYTPNISGGAAIQRTQRLNVDLTGTPAQGDVFGNYNFVDGDGGSAVDLATLVEDWLDLLKVVYNSGASFDLVELWKYPVEQSFESIFWSSYNPTVAAGTSGSANQSAGQDIYTFRTAEGGILKLSLMENVQTPGPPIGYAALGAPYQAIVDFILEGDGATYGAPFLARDTSYPFAFIKEFPGRNEALWKVRNGR